MQILINRRKGKRITGKLKKIILMIGDETAKEFELADDLEVSLVFTDNEEIHALNKQYRGIDAPTDVLSFAFNDAEDEGVLFQVKQKTSMLGDIIISCDRAEEQAKEYGHSLERELAFLFLHGLLHLLGYDHINEDEANIMNGYQEHILGALMLGRE